MSKLVPRKNRLTNRLFYIIALFLFFFLLPNAELFSPPTVIKVSDISSQHLTMNDNAQSFINELFEIQNIPQSGQLSKCLAEPVHSQKISIIIYQFARNGSISSSALLPKILNNAYTKIKSSLPQNIINCLSGSNDFQILLHHYNITFSNIFDKFQHHSKMNFLSVHYSFTNMTSIFSNSQLNQTAKYEKVAQILNDLAMQVYLDNGIYAEDPWKLRVQKVQTLNQYYGISVSNGVLGIVSSQRPLKLTSSVLAGAYDKVGRGRVDNLIQTFPALNMELYFNGVHNYMNYVQQVNMKEGSMTHSMSSPQFSLTYTYYTLQNLPNICYTLFKITGHENGELVVKNVQEGPQGLIDLTKYYEDIDTSVGVFHIISSEAKTKTGKLALVSSSAFKFNEEINILHEDWDSNLHLQKFRKSLKQGEEFSFAVITCLMSSENHQDPINEAIRLVIRASSMNNILAGHFKKWQQLWTSDIIIQGNDNDQKSVRSMLYHCYSFISPFKSYGLSPMGLSGLGYNGHVFWDMDLWIYPAILALKPSLAQSLINYRYERLEAAKQNAFLNGYKGAMYPWQSSKSGNEETPVWALSGPLQHHISGCVAFGAWNYYAVTQNRNWLKEKGYPIIKQVSEFFISRVQLGQDGMYHIKNVVGADQWAQNIDDDAFTNGIAKASLLIANKAQQILNLPITKKYEQVSNKIVILKMQNGVTKEHSTYKGEDIKQADVNLLSYPLNIVNRTDEILKDLQYYKVRVPSRGTPAMTYSIFTVLYSKLKNGNEAYKNFKQSFEPYLKEPFGVFSETKGGSNPYFLTGAGGVLQSMVFGFGGFNIGDKGIYITNNSIPSGWKKVTIKAENQVVFVSQNQQFEQIKS